MTPRPDVIWIAAGDDKQAVLATVRESPHRQFVVSRGSIDEIAGVVRKEDILDLSLGDGSFDLAATLRQPIAVPETTSVLDALNLFKERGVEMALVVDEYGSLQGIVTQTDLLPGHHRRPPGGRGRTARNTATGGRVRDRRRDLDLRCPGAARAQPLAGRGFPYHRRFYAVRFNRIPAVGEHVDWGDRRFEVRAMDGLRIDKVLARRIGGRRAPAASP